MSLPYAIIVALIFSQLVITAQAKDFDLPGGEEMHLYAKSVDDLLANYDTAVVFRGLSSKDRLLVSFNRLGETVKERIGFFHVLPDSNGADLGRITGYYKCSAPPSAKAIVLLTSRQSGYCHYFEVSNETELVDVVSIVTSNVDSSCRLNVHAFGRQVEESVASLSQNARRAAGFLVRFITDLAARKGC